MSDSFKLGPKVRYQLFAWNGQTVSVCSSSEGYSKERRIEGVGEDVLMYNASS